VSDENGRTAYELAYGQLRSQKTDLQFFRGQASFAAAVSGIIASVFSSIAGEKFLAATDSEIASYLGITLVGWLVLLCFALSVGCAVKAFMSWSICTFDLNPKTAIFYAEHGKSNDELLLNLALDADGFFDQNENVITETRKYLSLALIFAWCQIPAWLILISS
jgi:hypothetical protein